MIRSDCITALLKSSQSLLFSKFKVLGTVCRVPVVQALAPSQASRGNGASSGVTPGLSRIRTPSPVFLRVSTPGWAPLCNQGSPAGGMKGVSCGPGSPFQGLVLTLCAPQDSEARSPSFFHRHPGLGFKGTWKVGISPPHIGAQLPLQEGL